MPTARHGIEAAMWNGSANITDGGLKQGGGAPTDVQGVLTVGPNYRPDTQIRLSTETSCLTTTTSTSASVADAVLANVTVS